MPWKAAPYCQWTSEQKATHNKRNSDSRISNRTLVLGVYSGWTMRCACCAENDPHFLSIDHISGGGTEHKRRIGGSAYLSPWLIKEGFPEGFQVLCHNCNQAKHIYGVCPHGGVEV